MKEILLVVAVVSLAHGIVWCRSSTGHAAEPEHAGRVAEYNQNFKVEMTSEGAVAYSRWLSVEE